MTARVTVLPEIDQRRPDSDTEDGFGALRTDRGNLPLDQLDLRASITGLTVGMELTQGYRNPLDEPLEATYIFPLPDRAAVTSMRMEADGRVITAEIRERAQAREDYQAAIDSGQRASIAEQERSGVFTMRVGNIMPGERVLVRLTLAGLLPFEDGAATFRMPLVVAPRYVPGIQLPGQQVGDGYAADTDLVPDASRITPPVLLPGFPNPVRLSARVDIDPAGLPLPGVRASLPVTVSEHGEDGSLTLDLDPGQRADRDFVLRLDFGSADGVITGLVACPDETADGASDDGASDDGADGTFAVTVLPPPPPASARPKDVALVLDRSGSMHGWKIVAARRAAARIVDSLTAADRLAVYAFDHEIERPPGLPAELAGATDANRFRAVEQLAGLQARGGTEMLAPLLQAARLLAGAAAAADGPARDKVLVLITDGQVGNEDHILHALRPLVSGIRMHAVGVDTAVNEGFLRSLAAIGGGRLELVGSEEELDEAIRHIHQRIATPVVTGLRIESEGMAADLDTLAPARLPDLFAGAPLVITGRGRSVLSGGLAVTGTAVDGTPWRQQLTAAAPGQPMLAAVWARMRIRDLEDSYVTASGPAAGQLEQGITATSLRFGVLSRFTAMVAIDERVVNEGGVLHRVTQPVELPHGWEMHMQPAAGAMLAAQFGAPGAFQQPMAMPGQPGMAGPGQPGMAMPPAMWAPGSAMPMAAPSHGRRLRLRDGMARSRRASGTAAAAPAPAAEAAAESARNAVPRSAREFAAKWRAELCSLDGKPAELRSAWLTRFAAQVNASLGALAADGLDEALVRQLRELAAELASPPPDVAGLQLLWLRAGDVLDGLAGESDRSAGAFWRRQP
jgi:Ca-activated chloride channel family protein